MDSATVRATLGAVVDREGGGPPGWADRIAAYLDLLTEANETVNLVSRKTVAETLQRHVLPSLAALLVVPAETALRVLDVGTGGGFPGVPLAILRPEIRLDLVDATRKKCEFLETVVRELELPATVHWCRIEDPPAALPARAPFDRILARAMGSDHILHRAVAEWIAPGGGAWVFAPPAAATHVWKDERGQELTGLRPLS